MKRMKEVALVALASMAMLFVAFVPMSPPAEAQGGDGYQVICWDWDPHTTVCCLFATYQLPSCWVI